MAKFWVHASERLAHHIIVEAPSIEAAEGWAADHVADFIYETAREDDETVTCELEATAALTPEELERYHADDEVEVVIDTNGNEVVTDEEKEPA